MPLAEGLRSSGLDGRDAGIKMEVFYDRSQTIRAAVDDLQITLIIAGLLVVAVIFLFLRRVSATVIPSLALREGCPIKRPNRDQPSLTPRLAL